MKKVILFWLMAGMASASMVDQGRPGPASAPWPVVIQANVNTATFTPTYTFTPTFTGTNGGTPNATWTWTNTMTPTNTPTPTAAQPGPNYSYDPATGQWYPNQVAAPSNTPTQGTQKVDDKRNADFWATSIAGTNNQLTGTMTFTPVGTLTPTNSPTPTFTPNLTNTITNTPTFTPTALTIYASTSGWNNANGVTVFFPGIVDGLGLEQVWSSVTGVAGVSINAYFGATTNQSKTTPLIFPNAVPSADKWSGVWGGNGSVGSFGPASNVILVPQATITPTFSPVVTFVIQYHLAIRVSDSIPEKYKYLFEKGYDEQNGFTIVWKQYWSDGKLYARPWRVISRS